MTTIYEAAERFPAAIRADLVEAAEQTSTVPALLSRREVEPGRALMAGLALDPNGRAMLDQALERYARPFDPVPTEYLEVIVGAGIHAAIYSAVRRASGFPAPLVLDPERFGGTFALAGRPSFYLNSRNRPGPLGAPGSRGALNVLPAGPMQPADIGASEYQTDADLGLCARCALALNARVRSAKVERVERNGSTVLVLLDDGSTIRAGRVIVATGVTAERTVGSVPADGSTVFGFRDWFRRMAAERFPLADLGRVAVIGNGDGARVVIESLTGIGPALGMSTASLDYVDRIDWYGPGEGMTRSLWCGENRNRYGRIGSLLPRERGDTGARVRPLDRANRLSRGYGTALVNGSTYDTVITAVGYRSSSVFDLVGDDIAQEFQYVDRYGTRLGQSSTGSRVALIGPAANIPFEPVEPGANIGENRVGLFRLGDRTAQLAALLTGATLD